MKNRLVEINKKVNIRGLFGVRTHLNGCMFNSKGIADCTHKENIGLVDNVWDIRC